VVDASMVITTHLIEIIKANMSDLLSYAETQKILDEFGKDNGKLIAELVPARIGVGSIQRILQNLLNERISIRDIPAILEGVSEAVSSTNNIDLITEHVRYRLARQISAANVDDNGIMHLVTLSPEWENLFAEGIVGSGEEINPSLSPTDVQKFALQLRQTFEGLAEKGIHAVLMTSPQIRFYVRQIVERYRPSIVVISQREVHPKIKIKMEGQI
jgi:flagellar biosynthesis protein FlhA